MVSCSWTPSKVQRAVAPLLQFPVSPSLLPQVMKYRGSVHLLLDLMASLYAWPVLSPPLAVFPCWWKAWLAVVMVSRGMMFPKGPMSG